MGVVVGGGVLLFGILVEGMGGYCCYGVCFFKFWSCYVNLWWV